MAGRATDLSQISQSQVGLMTQQVFEGNERKQLLFRSSKRISITIPFSIAKQLEAQSDREGRSLSNLASYLLERSISEINARTPLVAP